MAKEITRREFVKQSAGGVVAIGAALSIGPSMGMTKERDASKPTGVHSEKQADAATPETKPSFFDPHQFAMVAVLAGLIVPVDDYLGAKQAGVAGFIDSILAQSGADRQKKYVDALIWLDEVSLQKYGDGFMDLARADQTELLERVFKMATVVTMKAVGLPQRLKRKALKMWHKYFDVLDNNAVLFLRLRKDVIYGFYADPSSWQEIGYFGPPQPVGYLNYANPPTSDSYTGSIRPVENGSCLNCHPEGTHPRGGLIDNSCQVCHRPHSPWHYDPNAFRVEDHVEFAFPHLDRKDK